MKLKKSLLWLVAISSLYFNAALAIDTPDFILETGRWEQLVIPADSSSRTVRELFQDDLPADRYGLAWVIFLYNAETRQYDNPGVDGTIATGAGFWIIQVTDSTVTLDLPERILAPDTQSSVACAGMECVSTPVFVDAEQTAFTMLGSPLTTPSVVNESRLSVSSGNRYCRNGCTLDDAVDRQYIYAPLWHYDSASNMYIDLSLVGQLDPWQAV